MKLTRRGALGTLAGAALAAPLAARAPVAEAAYVLPRTTVIPITARSNGRDYLLYVRLPLAHATERGKRWPVICTLDADYSFAIAANHLEHLADRMNQAPHAVLVSIAYPGIYPDMAKYRRARTRDYTPIAWRDGGYGPEFQKDSGGGPAFLAFLAEEVMPLVNRRFRGDAEDWTLVGHSYGGLFAAWVMQHHPDRFRRYLSVSPSLWYAEKWLIERARRKEHAVPGRDQRMYLAIGEWEEQPANGQSMVSETREYFALLQARGDGRLHVEHRVFADETHASIFPAAFSTGIRHLFRGA